MSDSTLPSPETTLVILLGASEFPNSSQFIPAPAFRNSIEKIKSYFLNTEGFGLPQENLLDLFDRDDPPSDLDGEIADFLSTRFKEASKDRRPRDVVVYYVGHGGFSGGGSDYYLALRHTSTGREYITSYPIKSLAANLKENARHLRRYLILDSCFSAAAYSEFLSAPLETACRKTRDEFPPKGTALLCASGPKDPAKVLPNQEFTMFSGTLAKVLSKGDPDEPQALSLAQVGDLTLTLIRELFPQDAVRPEVHSPDQREGDIAGLPLFPNPARRRSRLETALNKVEEKIQDLESWQRHLDSAQQQVQTELRGLALRMEKMGKEPASVTPPGDLIYGLTPAQWKEIPGDVKALIYDYSTHVKVGRIWLSIALIFLFLTISLPYLYKYITDATYYYSIFSGMIFSGIIMILTAKFLLRKRVITVEEIHGGKLPDGVWSDYYIVVKASKQKVVEFVPGFCMENIYFFISSFLYLIAFLALLVLLLERYF